MSCDLIRFKPRDVAAHSPPSNSAETVKLRGSQSLTLGINIAKPSLNMGEKMRLLAVRATQRCDVARQVSKALRVQLHTSIDHIAGSRAYKLQNAHRYILTLLALIRRDEKPRRLASSATNLPSGRNGNITKSFGQIAPSDETRPQGNAENLRLRMTTQTWRI